MTRETFLAVEERPNVHLLQSCWRGRPGRESFPWENDEWLSLFMGKKARYGNLPAQDLAYDWCSVTSSPSRAVLLPQSNETLIHGIFYGGYCVSCGYPPMNEPSAEELVLRRALIKYEYADHHLFELFCYFNYFISLMGDPSVSYRTC